MALQVKQIVILPRAGAGRDIHEGLISRLEREGFTVDFVTGYFGSASKNSLNMLQFEEVLKSKINRPVILIGESVGAIHAINYAQKFPQFVYRLILFNPSIIDIKLRPLFKLALGKQGAKFIKRLINLIPAIRKVCAKVGVENYVSCLREIVDFPTPTLASNSVVILGRNDPYKFLTQIQHKGVKMVNGKHGLLDKSGQEVVDLIHQL